VLTNLWKSLFLAAGVITFGGAAMAADIVRPPPLVAKPVVVRAYSWAGHYIGVQGGWDNNHATDVAAQGAADANGTIFGVFAGFNHAVVGPWVFGIDGSINWTNASGATATPGTTFDADWKGFIRGRAGVAFDRLLFYGTFGAVVARFNQSFAPASSATDWGWTAGVGADFALHNNMFLRVDWAYQNYGDFAPTATGVTANTVTVGLGFKF
jgi:outer membrane immunogenic protein